MTALVCYGIFHLKTLYFLIFFVDLNPFDDLESLAYTLLFLLKGSPHA